MRYSSAQTARVSVTSQRDSFVALVQQVWPRVSRLSEIAVYYLLVCSFWGLILFAALHTFAAQ